MVRSNCRLSSRRPASPAPVASTGEYACPHRGPTEAPSSSGPARPHRRPPDAPALSSRRDSLRSSVHSLRSLTCAPCVVRASWSTRGLPKSHPWFDPSRVVVGPTALDADSKSARSTARDSVRRRGVVGRPGPSSRPAGPRSTSVGFGDGRHRPNPGPSRAVSPSTTTGREAGSSGWIRNGAARSTVTRATGGASGTLEVAGRAGREAPEQDRLSERSRRPRRRKDRRNEGANEASRARPKASLAAERLTGRPAIL